MAQISDYISMLPGMGRRVRATKKILTPQKRKFLRKRAKLARRITRNNRK